MNVRTPREIAHALILGCGFGGQSAVTGEIIRRHCESCDEFTNVIIDAKIEELEEAAKSRCSECRNGDAPTLTVRKRWAHSPFLCVSFQIHNRIAELRAEAPVKCAITPSPIS